MRYLQAQMHTHTHRICIYIYTHTIFAGRFPASLHVLYMKKFQIEILKIHIQYIYTYIIIYICTYIYIYLIVYNFHIYSNYILI